MGDEEAPEGAAEVESAPPESPPDRPSQAPPAATASGSSAPGPQKESRRRRLEGVIPEIVRRAVELGVEKAQEAPDNLKHFVGDMKVPKDIAHYLFAQIDETKNGLFRVVAKEIRDFLEHTNFAGEVQKLLTTVQFEVNTTIRFTPNDGRDKRREEPDDPAEEDEAGVAGEGPSESASERKTPLPRPEVKTSVHVRRDDRSPGRRRGSARGA
jgi:hypothetical protein